MSARGVELQSQTGRIWDRTAWRELARFEICVALLSKTF